MFRVVGSVCLVALLGGCEAVRLDLGYPGGVVGHAMEPKLPAFSQTARVNRYLVGLAILAPMMAESASDRETAEEAGREIERSLGALAKLAEAADRTSSDSTSSDYKTAGKYAFETLEYDLQKAYYRAVKIVVLNLNLDIELSDLATANPIRLLQLLSKADGVFETSRRGAAVYRDTVVLVADAVLGTKDIKSAVRAYHKRRQALGADAAGEKPYSKMYFEVVDKLAKDEDFTLEKVHIDALLHHVWRACEGMEKRFGTDDPCAFEGSGSAKDSSETLSPSSADRN